MERCGKYEDIMARFIHGEILLHEKDLLEGHIAVCPDCERLYQGLCFVDRELRAIPDRLAVPPPRLTDRIRARIDAETAPVERWFRPRWAAVAGLAAACILAVAFYFGGRPEVREEAKGPAAGPTVAAPAEPPAGQEPAQLPESAARTQAGSSGSPGKSPPKAARGKEGRAVASAPKVEIVREVRIFFFCPPAARVAVTGDFNGWDPEGVSLVPAGRPGLWEVTLRLKPGAYSYNFLVDGNLLVPDPDALNQMPDGYGGTNSILLVRAGNSV